MHERPPAPAEQLALTEDHVQPRWRLRPEQDEAVRAIHATWRSHGRALLLWPCGYGKTVAYAAAAHQWGASLTVVMVSSLDLIPQVRDAFTGIYGIELAQVLAVCSRREQLAGPEHIPAHLEVISDPRILAQTASETTPTVIVATYHSLNVLLQSCTDHNLVPDVLVCDEAHHTVGDADADWVRVHHDLPARVRLYGTATPRHLDVRNGRQVYSMDDETTFGPVAHSKTFGQGIAEGRLADYQVLATLIGHEQIYAALRQRHRVSVRGHDVGVDLVAAQIATLRAIEEHDLRSIICYVPTLAWAHRFSESLSVAHALGHDKLVGPRPVRALHINGTSTQPERERARRALAHPGRATTVVTVVGCYIEGVDVPAVDAVGLFSGTRSRSRLIQQIGRALRLGTDSDKIAKLLAPLYVPPGAEPEAVQDDPSYARLLSVLHGLRSIDERLGQALTIQHEQAVSSEHRQALSFENHQRRSISLPATWVDSISTQILDTVAPDRLWWANYRQCQRFQSRHGHLRIPLSITTSSGRSLNQWLNAQNRLMREDLVSSDKRRALDSIGIDGLHQLERTLSALEPLANEWLREHDELDPPPTHPLYELLDKVREAHQRGTTLPEHWARWLREQGFLFHPRSERRTRRIHALAAFVAERGRMPDRKVPAEFPDAALLHALRTAHGKSALAPEHEQLCHQYGLPLTGKVSSIPPPLPGPDGTEHLSPGATVEDLVKALEQGAPTEAVARACGIKPHSVTTRLRERGLGPATRVREHALASQAQEATTDEDIEQLARRFRVTPSRVRGLRPETT